jgi:sensor c-di-GMP phosphodiesterase-like protein
MKETITVYSTDFIGRSTRRVAGRTYGIFKDCRRSSTYQPVFNLAHKRIVGYEALIRAERLLAKYLLP